MGTIKVKIQKTNISDPSIDEKYFDIFLNNLSSDIVNQGHLVVFPTETVYGLGGNINNRDSILSIFELKNRPSNDPLICHVSNVNDAIVLYDNSNILDLHVIKLLGERFWPGPLSIVSKASPTLLPEITSGTGYVCVRCPNHPVALELLKRVKVPLAAPSANKFGHISPSCAEHVLDEFDNNNRLSTLDQDVLYILDGNPCSVGIESTVCKVESLIENDKCELKLSVLRLGHITCDMIMNYIQENKKSIEDVITRHFSKNDINPNLAIIIENKWKNKIGYSHLENPKTHSNNVGVNQNDLMSSISPGTCITHYSPSIPTYLIDTSTYHDDVNIIQEINMNLNQNDNTSIKTVFNLSDCVIIDPFSSLQSLAKKVGGYLQMVPLAKLNTDYNIIHVLQQQVFTILHEAESIALKNNKKAIGILDFYEKSLILGDGVLAVYDRLYRSASGIMFEFAM